MSPGKGGKPSPTNAEAIYAAELRRVRASLARSVERLEMVATDVNGLAARLERHEPDSPTVARARAAVLELVAVVDDLAGERGG